ncbi:MAG: hypothetical protein O8C62_08825, partial [Candidatus Methanoperedens sp.]|nr:hypothetical protein [Candidatus Methanoperedens sp.]
LSDSYLTKFNRYIKIQKKHEKVGSLSMNIHHMLKIQGKLQVNRNPLKMIMPKRKEINNRLVPDPLWKFA